jgi:hypothetical protein
MRSGPLGWLGDIDGGIKTIYRYIKPLFSVSSLIGLLVFLLIISWFGNSRLRYSGQPTRLVPSNVDSSRSSVTWENMWQKEEEALWEWLQDRTGLRDGLSFPTRLDSDNAHSTKQDQESWRKILSGTKSEAANTREIEWAIKLTEERLDLLKRKVRVAKQSNKQSARTSPITTNNDDGAILTDEEVAQLDRVLQS